MKPSLILAFVLCGFLLRVHGWHCLMQQQTKPGLLLVLGGTLVTLSLVAVLLTSPGA